ncbi:MAG: radical SAM protein [Vulcanimicrobiota bacterium]
MMQLDCGEFLVLFNRFSGALAVAKKKWIDAISESEKNDLFNQNQLLLSPERESHFRNEISGTMESYRKNRGLNFYISPHFDCPMGCQYCFQQNVKECSEHLEIRDIDNIMQFIGEESRKQGIDKVIVVLFGGEPLLPQSFDFNEHLLQAAQGSDYRVRIVTSGTTLTDRYFELITRFKSIISDIDITIDGPEDIHNKLRPLRSGAHSYEIIRDSVTRLVENGFPVSAKINIGTDNIGHLGSLFETFTTLRWTDFPRFRIVTNFVRNYGGLEVHEQRLADVSAIMRLTAILNDQPQVLKDKIEVDGMKLLSYIAHSFLSRSLYSGKPRPVFCNPDSKTTYSIGPDCRIYSCNWMVGKEEFSSGSVVTGKKESTAADVNPCEECPISTLCGGGCLIERSQPHYFDSCYQENVQTIQDFIKETAPQMDGRQFMLINSEFKW